MSWKVLITAHTMPEVGQKAAALLENAGCCLINPPRMGPLHAAELIEWLPGMDAVLASTDAYTSHVLGSQELSHLKIISRWGVGFDSIDIAAATKAGIVVAYTPGLLNEAVADYTFALLLGIARRVHQAHQVIERGEWRMLWGHSVSGKTIGLIGCGRIGQAVARRARGFNMRVLAYDISPSPELGRAGIEPVSLNQLLEQSDFVSLHSALTPESTRLIGRDQLRLMKPTAYLVNTARGGLIDEEALYQALHENWIAGAAFDTYATEPLLADHPFRKLPNVLLSTHQSSFARETGETVSMAAAQAIVDLFQGRRPQQVVNPDVFGTPQLRAQVQA